MSRRKLKIVQTNLKNLVSNLRGEVGEVITSMIIMRNFMAARAEKSSGNVEKDINDRDFQFTLLLIDKFQDEIVGRLSELAERKIGQLTFHFAAEKLGSLKDEVLAFEKYVISARIREKRNHNVSHKMLPESALGYQDINILYQNLIRTVAMAVALMKKIDKAVFGPSAKYLWYEMRKRRYHFMSPPRVGYMLLPYLNLSKEARLQIIRDEINEGKNVWSEIETTIAGKPGKVLACKQWAIIIVNKMLYPLDVYPLVELQSLDFIEEVPSEKPNE